MNRQKLTHLVARLEHEATDNATAFLIKVALASLCIYFFFFIVLAGVGILLVNVVHWLTVQGRIGRFFQLSLYSMVLIPVLYAALRLLLTRMPEPAGHYITRAEAPQLFALIDQMQVKLAGPTIQHVVLDGELRVSVVSLPKYGLLGGSAHYLVLGLPFLLSLSSQEAMAAVVREYAHLCSQQNKFKAWVYRQRHVLNALHAVISRKAAEDTVDGILTKALDYFMPYYNAYTVTFVRAQEYTADAMAARWLGARVHASGLIRTALLGQWWQEHFWPNVYRQADHHPRPGFMPFYSMRKVLKASYAQWATRAQLTVAWKKFPDATSTQPSLRERVQGLGQDVFLPEAVNVAAAEFFLVNVERCLEIFDRDWWRAQQRTWSVRYEQTSRAKQRLQELTAQPIAQLLPMEVEELATLKAEFESAEAAKPLLEYLLQQPGGPFNKAEYLYGRILLEEDDVAGLKHLQNVAANGSKLSEEAVRSGYRYLLNKRGTQEAQSWLERMAIGVAVL